MRAGFPLTQSIRDLCNAECLWFYIKPTELRDCVFHVDIECGDICFLDNHEGVELVSDIEILNIVKKKSSLMPWQQAVDQIRELMDRQNREGFFLPGLFGMGGYKPVYFVIFD